MKSLLGYYSVVITSILLVLFISSKIYPQEIQHIQDPRDVVVYLQMKDTSASGIIIAPGKILTAGHVGASSKIWRVGTPDGKQYTATIVKSSEKADLALLDAPEATCPCATLAKNKLLVDDPVVVVGYPLGQRYNLQFKTYGHYQGMTINEDKVEVDTTDAFIAPGNSGGGLFNKDNELVGVTSQVSVAFGQMLNQMSFFVPKDKIKEFLDE